MAKKMYEQLGEELFNSSEEVSTKSIAKADFDKSYKTTIVGCNRYFTDDVPAETQAELIKKYNIPEVTVSGVYYTFRINGNWYVKSSNNDFKLYEEVVVRVPNGNWDNMFIEVQRDTVSEGGGTGVLSAVKIDGNKLWYNDEEYRLQFGNNKRIMCITKGKLHYIVETEDVHGSYIEAATAVLNGLTNDCDIEFDANIFYPNDTYSITSFLYSSADLTRTSIDWGDGNTTTYPEISHVYGKQGMFRVKINGLPDSITSINCVGINHFWNGQNGCKVGSHTYIGGSITTINTYSTYISKLTWGENVTEIRQSYGMGEAICDELREMAIPPKVSVIGSGGYDGQSNYAYIPPECTSIERMAFYNVPLKDIEISPDGDTLTLGDYAFNQIANTYDGGYSCVTSLEIPTRVKVGQYSFYNMGTRIVKFERGTEEITSYAINSINRKASLGISCPSNYNELYIFIPSTVTKIGSGIIYGGSDSKRVIIVYEGSSSDWDKITKATNWNSGNTKIKFIYGAEEYNSYPFCVREIKKFHEFKSDDDGAYVAGNGITISDSVISINAGNGLIFDRGAININVGTGLKCDPLNGYKVGVMVGDGLEIVTKEGSATPEAVNGTINLKPATETTLGGVKAGSGITVAEDGTISAKGKDFMAGDGIDITDTTISVKPATSNTIGGIKAGKGLKISSDGTLETEGGSGNYTAGSGIEITEDDVINVKQATSTERGGVILGEGLEYDPSTGKTNTVPNIQQAVILQEKDAKYLLHEYTTVEYIAGNRICYAGGQNQIVVQGYIVHKNGGTAPNGVKIASITSENLSELPDIPMYTDMSFPELAYYASGNVRMKRIYFALRSSGVNADNYDLKSVNEDGSETNITTIYNYNNFGYGFALLRNTIYPPGYTTGGITYPYGCVSCTYAYKAKTGTKAYEFYFQNEILFYIGFASEAEYNAAVGLTYEPQTLANVEETITEVTG